MSRRAASLGPTLGRKVAAVLRGGTVLAMLAIAIGFVIALLSGAPSRGARRLVDLFGTVDADALISVGLLGFTLLPLGVLVVAARSFHLAGERRYLVACIVTLGLLVSSLVIAALVAPSG
jgi:uncharacterized membrane protein